MIGRPPRRAQRARGDLQRHVGVPQRDHVTGWSRGQQRAAERLGPHVFLEFIRERTALFFGLADSTMSHDDAWRFLVLGRSLERADMTARLLLARMPAAPYDLGWPMLLRACGAYESFIRSRTLDRRARSRSSSSC